MKRLFAIALALVMVLTFVACGNNTESVDVASAQNIADLSGAKIAAQAASVDKSAEEYKKTMDPRQIDYLKNDVIITKLFDYLKANNEMYVEESK